MKKLIKNLLSFVLTILAFNVSAGDFNLRINAVSCSTFVVQVQCTNNSYLPTTSHSIDAFDFNIISQDAFTLSITGSFNGFNIISGGTTAENGYNVAAFAEGTNTNFTSNFVLNQWHDVASFTITSGSTNLLIATTTETPSYGSYIFTPVYATGDEMSRSATNGTLAKTWVGTTTAWSTTSNWCPASLPTANENVVIPDLANDPALSANISVSAINIQSGVILNLNGNQLTIGGALTGTGTIRGSATSSLVVNGSTAAVLRMDQTTPGTTNILNNLTINNSGGVTLNNAIKVYGLVTLSSGALTSNGNLTLGATSTTAYGQIANTGSGSISGSVAMEKMLSNTDAGWRQVGLPFSNAVENLTGVDLLDTAHGNANERNIFVWDNSVNPSVSGEARGWRAAEKDVDTESLAYSIYGDNSHGGLHDISSTLNFTGTYSHNSNKNFSLTNLNDPLGAGSPDKQGWNLVPNPFPSNLSVSSLFSNSFGSISYKAVHIWNATSGQYQAICSTGVTMNSYNNSQSTSSSTVLAPFQAFWVKANSNTTFTINNSSRTTSGTGLGVFMKKNYDLARLNVLDKDSAWDQMVIYFNTGAHAGFDADGDAYKLISMNNNVPSLYSVTADGIFAINALDEDKYTHEVPLGFRSGKTGQFTFELNKEELDAKWYVYLEDKTLGIYHNLKNSAYLFTSGTPVKSDDRFVLHFMPNALSSEKLIADTRQMQVTGNGQEVYVFVPSHFTSQLFEIQIVDMMGRVVYSSDKVELIQGMNTLQNLNIKADGYYSVRVNSSEGVTSGKVLIRQ